MGNPWTPGPWKTTARMNNMIDIIHPRGDVPGAITHALCRVQARQSWIAEAEANARLIAEAPAMAEALEDCANELLSMFEDVRSERGLDTIPPHWMKNVDKARAILARIKGETP